MNNVAEEQLVTYFDCYFAIREHKLDIWYDGIMDQQITTLYIVRHGQSVANVEDVSGGNSPLTPLGREQAAQTKNALASVSFDGVYSSDLVRASETAAIIYGAPVPEKNQLAGLRERDFGALEGQSAQTWYTFENRYQAAYKSLPYKERIEHEYDADIEGDKSVTARVLRSLQAIAEQHLGQTVLVGTHAGPIRDVLMWLGHRHFITIGSFDNAGYVQLCWSGQEFTISNVVGLSDE